VKITITLDQLKEKRACDTGIVEFRKEFGNSVTLDWTLTTQLKIIQGPLRRWFGWAVHNGIIPMWSMEKANLEGLDLIGADLEGADLEGANLYRANLQGANLYRANLQETDLQGANLQGANLYRADLYGANLQGAKLYGAYLEGANLYGAYLEGANLYGANLKGADLQRAYLQWANLYRADLYGAHLQGAHLQKADLRRANLYGANLQGANLYGAEFYGANLTGVQNINPLMVLSANWRYLELSQQLTVELMRFDASNLPDGNELFDEWSQAGECPYGHGSFVRAIEFRERRYWWSPGQAKSPLELLLMLFEEADIKF
jgi:uncharacterized protein YjbI with pentapeptide repeats